MCAVCRQELFFFFFVRQTKAHIFFENENVYTNYYKSTGSLQWESVIKVHISSKSK